MYFEAVLQAILGNLLSSNQRVSGKLISSQSNVVQRTVSHLFLLKYYITYHHYHSYLIWMWIGIEKERLLLYMWFLFYSLCDLSGDFYKLILGVSINTCIYIYIECFKIFFIIWDIKGDSGKFISFCYLITWPIII